MVSARLRQLGSFAALLTSIAVGGCAEKVETSAPSAAIESAPIATEAAAAPEANQALSALTTVAHERPPDDAKAEAAASPTPADDEVAPPSVAEYQPPFPDRVDLFVPPKRQGGVVLKEGESEDAVELLGFIRLDRQQVVLSINGQITPIYEGASQYGIEVISITPPKVVLQRGRQRWQASLEN
jgi:hypothetical protein